MRPARSPTAMSPAKPCKALHSARHIVDTSGSYAQGCPCSSISGFGAKGIAMLSFRWYKATCPACIKPVDILPPESIVAENHGLAHRCPTCRRWLATYVRQIGSARHPDVRVIETNIAPDDWLQARQRLTG